MDGLHLLWVGDANDLCVDCGDRIEREGGWVSRLDRSRLAGWRARPVDVAIIDATRTYCERVGDLVEMVRRRAAGANVVLIADDLCAERDGVTIVGRGGDTGARVLAAVAQRSPRALGSTAAQLLAALQRMLEAPLQPLSPKLRATAILHALGFGAKEGASLLGIEVTTFNGYKAQAKDRLGWPTLDFAPLVLFAELADELTSLLEQMLGDPALAMRVVETLAWRPVDRDRSRRSGRR
jgi:hypothetical protein